MGLSEFGAGQGARRRVSPRLAVLQTVHLGPGKNQIRASFGETRLPGVNFVFESLAVVGATGAVGSIILDLLAERNFRAERFKFLASGRSAGKTVTFRGEQHPVELLEP